MSELRDTRLEKAKALKNIGQGPYGLNFKPTSTSVVLQEKYADLPNGEEKKEEVSIAGRVTSRRVMGKLAFFTLADETGTVQLFLEKATLNQNENSENKNNNFENLTSLVDSGDWIGVSGILRRTDRGELSIKVFEWSMLSKSLQPLPDKWHGLADVEKRYRQRYLDLIVNPQARKTFRTRALLVSSIRRWLDEKDFLEI